MIARVVIDRSSTQIDRLFDYEIPENLVVEKGDRVVVPFGNKLEEGFCVDIVEKSEYEVKKIASVNTDLKCLSLEMIELMHFMRKRFFLKYVDILRLFIPSAYRKGKVRELERIYITLNSDLSDDEIEEKIKKRPEKYKQMIKFLKEGDKSLSDMSFMFSTSCVNTLIKNNIAKKIVKQVDRVPFKDIQAKSKEVELKVDQKNALENIFKTEKSTILLHGVTGSGKTTVYIEAIKKVLKQGKNAIMLVPEISLTPQMLVNFRGVFGDDVALLHSGLGDGERFDEWKKLLLGQARIVVGARSAIFAPLNNVGLIVVDEEHDTSYISESNPRYRVLEIAQFRAKYNNAKVVLGSATPSIETYKNALDGKYELIKMPNRISTKGMPKIDVVDMKNEILRGNNSIFSRDLKEALKETFDKGEQAMLLINRLGYSSFIRCKKCGYIPKCNHCDVSLTYHKRENRLICHYCGAKYEKPYKCPKCGSSELKFGKIGTETVVEEINKLYPTVKTLKLDSETKKQKDGMISVLRDFSENKAQVLVGTQMIAKGHDFSNVTLVGLVDADLSLFQQDFRSNERTFQLVTQMAGRAGRAEKEGKVILQTYSPSSYVYHFATNYNYLDFYKKEVNVRETTSFPPFVSIIRIMTCHKDSEKARLVAVDIYMKMRKEKAKNDNIRTLAGMECPINKISNNFRYQVVLRINKEGELDTLTKIYEILEEIDKKDASVFVEQDPQSMM